MKQKLEQIIEPLLDWYQENKRILPWRISKNPYCIWISEIMLQQTRIEAVKSYYSRFMQEIPNIHDLANIQEERLLKLWEGLGYYNRARNLQKAAKIIEQSYQGKMPSTYEKLITLPGIGDYTAGAIASIAFNEKVPAVDGNVLRVISRIIGSKKDILLPETKKEISKLLTNIMPQQAGNFNEALMELGELLCVPNGEPTCSKCPLNKICKAYQENLVNEIPVRCKKVKRKIEEMTVLVLTTKEGKIAIRKRTKQGVLKDMYEFPHLEKNYTEEQLINYLQEKKILAEKIEFLGNFKHIFTHIEWKMIAYLVIVKKEELDYMWVTQEELKKKYALPTAFKQLMR